MWRGWLILYCKIQLPMLQHFKPNDSIINRTKRTGLRYLEIGYFSFVGAIVLFAFLSSVVQIIAGPDHFFLLLGKTILYSNKNFSIDIGVFLILLVFLLYVVKKLVWRYKKEAEFL